jgi:hypothetical protein
VCVCVCVCVLCFVFSSCRDLTRTRTRAQNPSCTQVQASCPQGTTSLIWFSVNSAGCASCPSQTCVSTNAEQSPTPAPTAFRCPIYPCAVETCMGELVATTDSNGCQRCPICVTGVWVCVCVVSRDLILVCLIGIVCMCVQRRRRHRRAARRTTARRRRRAPVEACRTPRSIATGECAVWCAILLTRSNTRAMRTVAPAAACARPRRRRPQRPHDRRVRSCSARRRPALAVRHLCLRRSIATGVCARSHSTIPSVNCAAQMPRQLRTLPLHALADAGWLRRAAVWCGADVLGRCGASELRRRQRLPAVPAVSCEHDAHDNLLAMRGALVRAADHVRVAAVLHDH